MKKPDWRVSGVKRIRNIGKKVHKSGFLGYPGLAKTAIKIAEYIPPCDIYVEPFAGLGRVARHVSANTKILNDKSDFAFEYLQKKFPTATVLQMDFAEVMKKFDSENTFQTIDPPWDYTIYNDNALTYCDRKPREYYAKILRLLKKSKSHWFVCCSSKQKLSGYEDVFYTKIIEAHQARSYGFGLSKVKIYSNKPFIRYNQVELV